MLSCKRPRMFSMIYGCNVIIKSLILRFLCQKYEFYISGLMNARLSVHCSLKRAKRRNYRLCTLTSSLKRTDKRTARLGARLSVQHLHNIFENTSCGPECNPILFFANICNFNKASCQETNAHYILKYYK